MRGMSRWIASGVIGCGALLGAAGSLAAEDTAVPLIPREVLFGNPDRAGVQISPDGTRLS